VLERRRADLVAPLLVVEALVADGAQRRPARIERIVAALPAAHRSRQRHSLEWSRADRTESVEAPASRQPLHRLAGNAGDRVEVAVVMEEDCVVHFRDRRDEEVDRRGAAMLASPSERRLRSKRDPFDPSIDRKRRQQAQIICETTVLSAAPR
jgi:hypothetical protein